MKSNKTDNKHASKNNPKKPDESLDATFEAFIRQAERNQKSRCAKVIEYFKKPNHWIEWIGIILVAGYTFVSCALWLAQIHANGINSATFVASERPYVYFKIDSPVTPAAAVLLGDGPGALVIPVKVVNSGSTWPINLHVRLWCGSLGANPDRNYVGISPKEQDMFVAPRDTNNFGSCDTPQQTVQTGGALYIGAEAIYTDSFSKTDTFVTEYCFTINGISETVENNVPNFSYYTQSCPTHNCADSACKKNDIPDP